MGATGLGQARWERGVSLVHRGLCCVDASAGGFKTYSKVAGLAAAVAASAGGVSGQAESWAVGLNMAKALAVVALLGLGSARERAAVGLVAGLLACGRGQRDRVKPQAGREAYSCSKGAQQRSRPRRSGRHCHICSRHDGREKTWCR